MGREISPGGYVNLCPGVGPFGVWGEVDAELIRARIIAACEMTRERERERERAAVVDGARDWLIH